MKWITMCAVGCLLAIGSPLPLAAENQAADDEPKLSPQEAEAYELSQQMQFGCNPQRREKVAGSTSSIDSAPAPLSGTAAILTETEGTFLVLENYNEDGSLHCAVLTRSGGLPEPRRYEVKPFAMSTLEAEATAEHRSFFGMFALKNAAESSILVAQSGFVEIETSEPGKVTGRFQLSGFTVDGATRTDGVTRTGTFTALQAGK